MAQTGFFGWTVVWGAAALAVCGWGLGFYGPPIYLHVIHASRHSRRVLCGQHAGQS